MKLTAFHVTEGSPQYESTTRSTNVEGLVFTGPFVYDTATGEVVAEYDFEESAWTTPGVDMIHNVALIVTDD